MQLLLLQLSCYSGCGSFHAAAFMFSSCCATAIAFLMLPVCYNSLQPTPPVTNLGAMGVLLLLFGQCRRACGFTQRASVR